MENARVLIVGDPPSPALLDSLPASVKAVALRRMADVRAVMKESPWPRRAFLHWSFLDRPVIRSLEDLRRQGVIVPITIYLDAPTRDAYARAWLAAGPLRASLVQPPDIGRQVRELLRNDSEALASYIKRRLAVSSAFCVDFVDGLASGAEAWTMGADALASGYGVRRTTLFERLHREGLPPPEAWQFLFRIVHASQVIQSGGTNAGAAREAGYSEPTAFRRALETKLGLRVEDLRQPGWRWLAERWLRRCMPTGRITGQQVG